MQIEISEFNHYLVLAGNGNDLKRYKVKGDELKDVFNKFDRVPYVGTIECFECYVCNPETGETGWDIVFIEGVKEKIQKYYPNFDCFITKDYPHSDVGMVEFYNTYRSDDDYKFAEIKKDEK